PVRGVRRWPALPPTGAAGAVRGFCSLANLLAPRRGPGGGDVLLAATARGPAAAPRAPHRPPATGRPELPRRHTAHVAAGRAHPEGAGSCPARGSDALH